MKIPLHSPHTGPMSPILYQANHGHPKAANGVVKAWIIEV
jgi:hypothetical protein